MGHELIVEEGVEDFGYDGEEGDWSVVGWEGFVFCFVDFNGFCDFESVRVLVFVDRPVVESSEDWGEVGGKVFYDGRFDLKDVAGFVGVDRIHHCGGFGFCDMSECEGWVGRGVVVVHDVLVS